jgi:hypothetical protein
MSDHLESTDDFASSMAKKSYDEALQWFTDWLRRRDQIGAQLSKDDLAAALEALASELRHEASENPNGRSAGLQVAASVLTDSAYESRIGSGG